MTPVVDYKIWLKKVADRYQISEQSITNDKNHWTSSEARQVFLNLCVKDNICLYQLSRTLGKHRTTLVRSLKRSKFNDKKIIQEIWRNGKYGETITPHDK